MNINKELSAVLDTFAREIVATAKGGTYINAKLDAVTRIVDLHIGAAQPELAELETKQGTSQDATRG